MRPLKRERIQVMDNEGRNFQSQENENEDKYLNCRVIITEQFTEPDPIIKQGDRTIVSKGNIATIIGKPKAFKTFLTSSIVAAFLEDDVFSISGVGDTCLFIDTEQSRSHVNMVQKRIYRLCDWKLEKSNDRLIMLFLREFEAEERLKISLQAIEQLKPDLIIIDGIRDMIRDFNDLKESAYITSCLMAISTNHQCGIITVLHQNKADNNARGHLGSELCNKSETVLQVVNSSGTATVSSIHSRNKGIEPFSFSIDNTGLPIACKIPKIEEEYKELYNLMKQAMKDRLWWPRNELKRQIMQIIAPKGYRTAERRIKAASDLGILKKNQAKMYILQEQEATTEQELDI